MIWASIMSSMGMLMLYAGFNENLIVLCVCGFLCFGGGMLSGSIIETRLEEKIEKLEKKLKEE